MEELILLPLNSIREDLELCAFYRIFMYLKARIKVMLNGKSDIQRRKFDTSFQTLVNCSCYPESRCVHLMSLMNLIEN